MPNFSLQQQPQYPLITIDTDLPICEEQVLSILEYRTGATLCVRSSQGHPKRGGYFFCISKNETKHMINLETIEGIFIDTFSISELIKFINHASGRVFDEGMLSYCQQTVNFRVD